MRCLPEYGVLPRRQALSIANALRKRGLRLYARKAPWHLGPGYMIWEKLA